MEAEELKSILNGVLEERSKIEQGIHLDHHEFLKDTIPFIQAFIEREKRKAERWEKIKTQVLGWGIIGLMGAAGTAIYHYFFMPPKQ